MNEIDGRELAHALAHMIDDRTCVLEIVEAPEDYIYKPEFVDDVISYLERTVPGFDPAAFREWANAPIEW